MSLFRVSEFGVEYRPVWQVVLLFSGIGALIGLGLAVLCVVSKQLTLVAGAIGASLGFAVFVWSFVLTATFREVITHLKVFLTIGPTCAFLGFVLGMVTAFARLLAESKKTTLDTWLLLVIGTGVWCVVGAFVGLISGTLRRAWAKHNLKHGAYFKSSRRENSRQRRDEDANWE